MAALPQLEQMSLGLNRGGFPKRCQWGAVGIDSPSGSEGMPKPYSIDLRGRVVEEVESGASRREAAERYGLSPSVVVI